MKRRLSIHLTGIAHPVFYPTTHVICGSSPPKPHRPALLSSQNSLSLPIVSMNFKPFVAAVGPVFWFQDQVEEIVLWTVIWMAAYSFVCAFHFPVYSNFLLTAPRLLPSQIPHIILIGVIHNLQRTPSIPHSPFHPLNHRRKAPFHGKPTFGNPKFNGRNVSLVFLFCPILDSDLRIRADLNDLTCPSFTFDAPAPIQHSRSWKSQFPLAPVCLI